jgi:hypothetical protein
VVEIESAEVALLAPGVTAAGDRVQDACAGSPLQVNFTVLANDPPIDDTVSL